jgi:hypothetical protein
MTTLEIMMVAGLLSQSALPTRSSFLKQGGGNERVSHRGLMLLGRRPA